MYGKSIGLSLGLGLLLLLITYSVIIGSVDVRSYFFPLLQSPPGAASLRANADSPLRVYMYDLPRRFHVGMLHRHSTDESPVTAGNFPPWPRNTGLKKQHSVEYWMMASLVYDGDAGGGAREAVRVLDPESADVFFVPFFSSLSFNTHGHNMTDPETEIDRKLQIDLMEFLRQSKYWRRSGGRDHVIPMTHPNAFRFLREQVNASILIVADFGRFSKTMSNLNKDVVAPYVHVVESFLDDDTVDPYGLRPLLLFFRGRTVRKDEGIVRAKLAKMLAGYDDVHYERSIATVESIKMFFRVIFKNLVSVVKDYAHLLNKFQGKRLSTQGMRSSKFCLHPAGDTPSSCRLFDAIVSHCVPVIVSDQIELPYEDEIDYSRFSIFFSIEEALTPGYMVDQLRLFPKERWIEMWKQLRTISHHYEFHYPPQKEDAVDMLWREIKHKLPGVKLAVHRNRRLKIPDWWGRRR